MFSAEAAFSKDGSTVYCCRSEGMLAVHLNPYSEVSTKLPDSLGEIPIRAVTLRPSDGSLLLATSNAVWAFSPEKNTATKLFDKPAGSEIKDLAFDPISGGLLVTVYPEAGKDESRVWWVKRGSIVAKIIFVRRLDYIDGPVFSSDGRLFFGAEGDIWRGFIEHEEEDDTEPNRGGTLVAVRYAPVACRETYGGSPSQIGASDLACSGTKIYAHVRRMGGSGWGTMTRLDMPTAMDHDPDKAITEKLTERVATYMRALGSIEVMDDSCGGWSNLCASLSGERVFYRIMNTSYLIENNGKPQNIPAKTKKSPVSPPSAPTPQAAKPSP